MMKEPRHELHVVDVLSRGEAGEEPEYHVILGSTFDISEDVVVVALHEFQAVMQTAMRVEEEAKQRAGAERHLEEHSAELVKARAELSRLKQEGAQPRRRLPAERPGMTHMFAIHTPGGRVKGYVTVGLYEDGSVGEVFVKLDQQGSQSSGFCDAWSIAVSMLLQTGTPLEDVCRKFSRMKFEPSGRTETPGIRHADSPIDYVARYLERRYVAKLPLADDAVLAAPGAGTP